MNKLIRNRKGQGLVEYALIIAGVALIAAAAIFEGKMRTPSERAATKSSFTARQAKPQREPSMRKAATQVAAAKPRTR